MMPLGAHRYSRCYACGQPSPSVGAPMHWRPIVRVRGMVSSSIGIACSEHCYGAAHILLAFAQICMDREDARGRGSYKAD